jgi:hypothetical protein
MIADQHDARRRRPMPADDAGGNTDEECDPEPWFPEMPHR